MKIFKSLIIEDENLARDRLELLLKDYPQIELIGFAADGSSAIEMINSKKPDLIFLDIQMPEWNGFQVLNALSHKPLVVFTTAFDNYLLEAFNEKSISYLLKPIEKNQLDMAIKKLNEMFPVELDEIQFMNQNTKLDRLVSKIGNRIKLFPLEEIFFIKAEDKQCYFYTEDSTYLTDYSLNQLESLLPDFFIRVHRSTIVNMNLIKQLEKIGDSKCLITFTGKMQSKIETGKSYYRSIREQLRF